MVAVVALAMVFQTFLSGTVRAGVEGFVRVNGTRFELNGARYSYLGTNFWYGMNLGAQASGGNRARLVRELDRLQSLGIGNLRILAGSEGPDGEPWRIAPALQVSPGKYNTQLLEGFDFLLSEMRKRDMHAVVCLNNFWPWSGGMSQYLAWAGSDSIPYPPPQPGGSWSRYQNYTAQFYSNERAMTAANDFVRTIVTKYSDEPAIMAWQLANEPRGGANVQAFGHWIERTAGLIKSLDKNHLVTIGSEGETPWPESSGVDFVANHSYKNIDYATAHIWAQNWGWFDPEKSDETFPVAVAKMKAYLADHAAKAKKLGKPLVIEEFGLARDRNSHDPNALTAMRDRYYREVFEAVHSAAKSGSPVAGVNFWAWAGEALPKQPYGSIWRAGDPFLGDPPHELQGWYSVYASDRSTLKIISEYTRKMSKLR